MLDEREANWQIGLRQGKSSSQNLSTWTSSAASLHQGLITLENEFVVLEIGIRRSRRVSWTGPEKLTLLVATALDIRFSH